MKRQLRQLRRSEGINVPGVAQEFRPLARRERGAYPPGCVRSEQQSQRAKGPARAGTFIPSECLRPRTGRPPTGANRWSSLIPTNSRDPRNFGHFPTFSHIFPQFLNLRERRNVELAPYQTAPGCKGLGRPLPLSKPSAVLCHFKPLGSCLVISSSLLNFQASLVPRAAADNSPSPLPTRRAAAPPAVLAHWRGRSQRVGRGPG